MLEFRTGRGRERGRGEWKGGSLCLELQTLLLSCAFCELEPGGRYGGCGQIGSISGVVQQTGIEHQHCSRYCALKYVSFPRSHIY